MADTRRFAVLATLLLALSLTTWIAPAAADDTPQTLRLITHNVFYGFTRRGDPRSGEWKRWMAAQMPDIVALQELNTWTPEKLAADAASWGHPHSVLLKPDGFSTGITSRLPISDVKLLRDGFHHGLLRCRIAGIWIYVIHFHPSNFARRIEEAALLKADIQSLNEASPRIILAGDFNGFSPADRPHYDSDPQLVPFFRRLDERSQGARNLNDGRMDYGGIQAILDQGFVDLLVRERRPDMPFVGTFPTPLTADEDHGTDRRLDYVFVTPSLLPSVVSAAILRDAATERLSDHFPVRADFRFGPAAGPVAPGSAESVFDSAPQLLQETGAGEGPVWHPERGLFTSGGGDIHLRSPDGTQSVFRQAAGSNGLLIDRQRRLVICEPVRRRVTRLEADGTLRVLAENYDGHRFNQPNDLTLDAANRLYFTDPCYGDRSAMEMRDADGQTVEGVYRIDPDGRVERILGRELDRPNGITVTPDDRLLYVADNNNARTGARRLWRFHLQPDGRPDLATQTLIYDWKTTRGPDGMKLDAEGRLYVAAGLNSPNPPHESADEPTAGIYVFSPSGSLMEFVRIPRDETTNCAFGDADGKTLYVTAGGSLWSLRTKVAGRTWLPTPQ
ncbi:MAG: SMP-30/gluconolactonase/LRE family protein [Planctomycetota bacterium]